MPLFFEEREGQPHVLSEVDLLGAAVAYALVLQERAEVELREFRLGGGCGFVDRDGQVQVLTGHGMEVIGCMYFAEECLICLVE